HLFRAAAEIQNQFWRRQRRHKGHEDADFHLPLSLFASGEACAIVTKILAVILGQGWVPDKGRNIVIARRQGGWPLMVTTDCLRFQRTDRREDDMKGFAAACVASFLLAASAVPPAEAGCLKGAA